MENTNFQKLEELKFKLENVSNLLGLVSGSSADLPREKMEGMICYLSERLNEAVREMDGLKS